jgi:hypothetical protein
MKKMKEQTTRTLALAITGFAALLVAAPDWARGGLLVFAGIYAVIVYAVDQEVRNALRRPLDSRLRGNDTRRAEAKSPAARRAAT